jgi:hypothetical protein
MSDEPKVEAVRDHGEKSQWGRKHFFARDGGKRTLNAKKFVIGVGFLFLLLAVAQFVFNKEGNSRNFGESQIPLPATLSDKKIDIPPLGAKTPTPAVSALKNGKSNRAKRANDTPKWTGPQVIARPRDLSKLPPGVIATAELITGASNGPVRAELSDSIIVNGETLIDAGSVLVGQGSSGDDRLSVSFSQVVLRDGTVGNISAQACDSSDKIAGLKGSKIGTKAVNIAGSVGLGFVAGMSEGFQDTQGQFGATVRPPSMKNALLNGLSTTAAEQSRELMSDLKNAKPVIEVRQGTKICVIFDGRGN